MHMVGTLNNRPLLRSHFVTLFMTLDNLIFVTEMIMQTLNYPDNDVSSLLGLLSIYTRKV